VSHVWDAMKKRQAEQAAETPPAGGPPAAPTQPVSTPVTASGPGKSPPRESPVLNGYAPELVAHHERGGEVTEDFRAVRTHLLGQYPDERFCILVTSAEKGEGKTVTCLNLAVVLAERQERRTLVVDFDLRRKKVAGFLHMDNEPGMADLLRGQAQVDNVVRPTTYPNLFVIPAGKASREQIGEVLHRPELEEIVTELRRRYDYVLFDTPPVTIAPDAGMLGRAVSDAILIVRMFRTPRDTVDSAIRLLHAANVKPVGIVLTHHKYYIPKLLYYHT
jgi:capsular exopolysaccharide synthesis family protein